MVRPPGEPPSFARWHRNALALAAGNLLYTAGFMIFYPYVPLIVRELGVTEHLESWVGLIVGGIFALTFVLTPIWGSVADHFGKKSMVLRACLGIAVTFVLLGWAPSLAVFMGLVFWIGAFNGHVAASLALAAANTPPARMGRALALVQSGSHLGGTLGPVLGAVLASALAAYQHLFYVSGALALLSGILALTLVRETHVPPLGPFRLHLLRDLARCLRLPNMAVLYLLNFIFSTVFFGNVSVLAIYLLELLGDAPGYAGLSLEAWVGAVNVALTVASVVALPLWGRALDRFQPGWVLALGLLLALACALPVPWLTSPLQLTIARAAIGVFGAGIMPAVVRLIKERAPPGMDARALAFGTSMYMLGHGGAPVLAGIVGPLLGLRAYFGLNVLLLAVGLALWLASHTRAIARRG
jgi:DHA1 family multidrug resistance protein-like MFS transporter